MKWLLGFVLFVSWSCTSTAFACSLSRETWLLPDGRSPVPTNVRIWRYVENLPWEPRIEVSEASFWLEDSAGVRVPAGLSQITLRGNSLERVLYVLTPREPLAPNSMYRVRDVNEFEPWSLELATSDGPDLVPPVLTQRLDMTSYAGRGTSCGDLVSVTVNYAAPAEPDVLLVTALDDYDHLDVQTWSGSAHSVITSDDGDESLMERSGNHPGSQWPEGAGNTVQSRFGIFDQAGNFSGFSEPSEVTLPRLPEEGCSLGVGRGEHHHASLWILVMIALWFVRRVCGDGIVCPNIVFQLRLPQAWRGKFFFEGRAGLDGYLPSAQGKKLGGAGNAVDNGYAVLAFEELQAEKHGLSLEQFRVEKLAEEELRKAAPRMPFHVFSDLEVGEGDDREH